MHSSSVRSLREKFFDRLLEIGMIILALLVLYPCYYMFEASVKLPKEFYEPLKFPSRIFWGNYDNVFERVQVGRALLNTLLICGGTLVLLIIVASMAGYTISRNRHKLFQILFVLFLAGMIIPFQTSMVPIYKLAQSLHLMNTRTLLVLLYTAGTIPFATMIYVGFTKGIPRELEEAASIDGYGPLRMYWLIIFPLLLPATGTLIVTTVFGFWNDFIGPLLYLTDKDKMTLITQIFVFKSERSSDWGGIFALCSLATLPLILLFVVTQKYMIKGLTAGAIKG
ncbi:carbohydrate ABC transporter permease [Cohnella lupini]|uniref:Raffinose/stachyose/melibiose transport system permease protein n=1 Tax=Cohnella lupini TaxID=1294267 RepID=A0A3D9HQL1_9BACL|nr:carbohydrate ABC transporter permease [Cohnella lupini]RED51793.1 raffinose/stachyose/melibiose transport system permease protein [Cohnella lupini]